MFRKIAFILLATILVFTVLSYYFPVIPYVYEQGEGQIKMVMNAKPIDKLLEDSDFPDSLKLRLMQTQEIRSFAFDELGLKSNKNYTQYSQTNSTEVLILLTACEPYSFKNHEWSFPIAGTVSYKGFFNHERARSEEAVLIKEGYDTDLGRVSAWSTLGWFKDPVTSGMLKKSEGQLANLIIHELSHGTIYIKDNTELNENLATFIGNEGAKEYLKNKYGQDSNEVQKYLNQMHDEKVFAEFVLSCMNRLSSLYSNFPSDATDSFRSIRKYQMISGFYSEIDSLDLNDHQKAKRIFGNDPYPNNTFFTSFKRYQYKQDEIEAVYKSLNNDIVELVKHYKEIHKK
jgi:predicted aminopeptidase